MGAVTESGILRYHPVHSPALREVQGYFAGSSQMYLQFPFMAPQRQISQCFLLTSETAKKFFLLASLQFSQGWLSPTTSCLTLHGHTVQLRLPSS